IEVSRNSKARTIGKMEVVDRIHLDPTVVDAQVEEQLAGNRLGISEQRVEVGGGVEGVTLATKRAAISADHIVLFNEQHAQPLTRKQVRADQTTNARADNDGLI